MVRWTSFGRTNDVCYCETKNIIRFLHGLFLIIVSINHVFLYWMIMWHKNNCFTSIGRMMNIILVKDILFFATVCRWTQQRWPEARKPAGLWRVEVGCIQLFWICLLDWSRTKFCARPIHWIGLCNSTAKWELLLCSVRMGHISKNSQRMWANLCVCVV